MIPSVRFLVGGKARSEDDTCAAGLRSVQTQADHGHSVYYDSGNHNDQEGDPTIRRKEGRGLNDKGTCNAFAGTCTLTAAVTWR
jgi:hypothetical protein